MENVQSPEVPIHVHLDQGPKHPWVRRGLIAAAGVLAFVGADTVANHLGLPSIDLPEIGNPFSDLGNNPAQADASLRPSFSIVKERFHATCEGTVQLAANVKGLKDELAADGHFDKVIWGDVVACGDSDFDMALDATVIKNDQTGKEVVLIKSKGLFPVSPRIDMTDYRNCAPDRTDMTDEEIQKVNDDYKAQLDQGKSPECDDGAHISGAFARGDDIVSKVIDTSNTAAQIAFATDSVTLSAMNDLNQDYKEHLKQAALQFHPNATIVIEDESDQQRYEEQLKKETDILNQNGYHPKIITDDQGPALRVEKSGGGFATVHFRSAQALNMNVNVINEEIIAKETLPMPDEANQAQGAGR